MKFAWDEAAEGSWHYLDPNKDETGIAINRRREIVGGTAYFEDYYSVYVDNEFVGSARNLEAAQIFGKAMHVRLLAGMTP
jgi:hypothetical protein